MNSRITAAIGLASIVFLSACATPQQQVGLSADALSTTSGKVGIVMTALPKSDMQFPGASCLLCLAAANIANASLSAHAKTLPTEDVAAMKDDIALAMRKKGIDAVVIKDELDVSGLPDSSASGPNLPKKNFSPLSAKYQVDKLVVVDIVQVGIVRPYASYIPTSDPKGTLSGTGYLVNLKNNTYEWYLPFTSAKSTGSEWDQPPKFPGLTNAYFQAVETSKDEVLRALGL